MGGMSGDAGQITPESMTQTDRADMALMMLIAGAAGAGGAGAGAAEAGAGAGAAAGAGMGAGAAEGAGAAGIGGSTFGMFSGMPEATATATTATAPNSGFMNFMFPQSANPMSSRLGVQDPTMAGIMDTIERIKASPLHQGGIPGEGSILQVPQGGVMLPQRKSRRMF